MHICYGQQTPPSTVKLFLGEHASRHAPLVYAVDYQQWLTQPHSRPEWYPLNSAYSLLQV